MLHLIEQSQFYKDYKRIFDFNDKISVEKLSMLKSTQYSLIGCIQTLVGELTVKQRDLLYLILKVHKAYLLRRMSCSDQTDDFLKEAFDKKWKN